MILTGLAALRHMMEREGPLLWGGKIITHDEAVRVLEAAGTPAEEIEQLRPPAKLQPPTEAMITARITACTTCEYYRKESDKCGICGCGAVVSQRSKSPLGSCPKGKWDQ